MEPEKVLIVYGSLAPGKPNHPVVEHLRGNWLRGIVRGKLENAGWGVGIGYPAFRPARLEEEEQIEASILISDDLVDFWPNLDEFEGDEYKRILVPFELESGEAGIGNIYAASDDRV
jgi:gamma-glutamylcyclotransferase (GGCT)/AIG2-like uncharacterized protein YtfP